MQSALAAGQTPVTARPSSLDKTLVKCLTVWGLPCSVLAVCARTPASDSDDVEFFALRARMLTLKFMGQGHTVHVFQAQCDRPWLIYDLQVCRLVSLAAQHSSGATPEESQPSSAVSQLHNAANLTVYFLHVLRFFLAFAPAAHYDTIILYLMLQQKRPCCT